VSTPESAATAVTETAPAVVNGTTKALIPTNGAVKSAETIITTPHLVNRNIYQKLLAIMGELPNIPKSGSGTDSNGKNFGFIEEAELKRRIQPLFVKYGVLFRFSVVSADTEEVLVSGARRGMLTTIEADYSFIDVNDPEGDRFEGTFFGQGEDDRDKAIPKAIANTIKYIMTSNFLIPAGNDPEAPTVPATTTVVNTNTSTPTPEAVQQKEVDDAARAKELAAAAMKKVEDEKKADATSAPTTAISTDIVMAKPTGNPDATLCTSTDKETTACGKEIVSVTLKGKTYPVQKLVDNAVKSFGQVLCYECQRVAAAKKKVSASNRVN